VGIEQKQIDPVESDAIHIRGSGEFEHRIQVDGRFSTGCAFAHQTGPHGIVQFWKITVAMLSVHKIRVRKCGMKLQEIFLAGNDKMWRMKRSKGQKPRSKEESNFKHPITEKKELSINQ
jgi:hypothetical protein